MIRIRVLGASDVSIGQRRIGMNTEILFALALHLTTRAGERVPREELLERFWTKGSGDQRRHALRQLLYRLRQKGLTLDEDGERIYLDPARVDSDLRDALADGWVEHASVAAIDAAIELTPRFSHRMAPAFLEWLDGVRTRLEAQHRKASLGQIALARREGRWADLDRWAHSILRNDAFNEEATLARAESAAMAGSKTVALEILDNYLEEVGEFSDELGRPAAQLRKRIAERRPDWALRGPKEVALIGRTEPMSRLTGLVDATWRGDGSAVILVGAPGIGKTRLAMETRAYAELKGMRSIVVRAEAANVERPLAVAQELIEAFLELPGVAGCDPESLRLVRKVVERKREASHRDAAAFMISVRDYLPDALRDLFDAVMHECRVIVVLDDYHHVDEASHALLRTLMLATVRTRLLWIASSRSGPRADAYRKSIEGDVPILRVDGLSEPDARALAAATGAAHSFKFSEEVLAGVAAASAGNPLFVRELSVARGRRPEATSLPDSLAHLIAERLGLLPEFQLRLLRVIALLGSDSTPARLHTILGGERNEVTRSIEALEADGLLHITRTKTFAVHECWEQALLESMKGATRASLSHECALTLAMEPGFDSNPHTLWRAAELYCEAGAPERATQLYEIAAEQLFAAGLPDEAAVVLQRAAAIVADGAEKMRVLSRLATVYLAAGDPDRVITTSQDVLRITKGQSPRELGACLCARADALMRLGQDPSRELRHICELATDISIPVATRQLACLTGIRIAVNLGRHTDIEICYQASREIAEKNGSSTHTGLAALVFLTERGPYEDLVRADRDLLALEQAEQSVYLRCMSLRFRCYSLRVRGLIDEAVTEGEKAFELARAHSLYHDAHLAAENLAFLQLDQADCERAQGWVTILRELSERTPYSGRTKAVGHAVTRLQMQGGDFTSVAESLSSRLDKIRTDSGPENRSSELATLVYCLTQIGRLDEAVHILPEAIDAIADVCGRYVGNYPVELVARTLRLLERGPEADSLTASHLREQLRGFKRPIPPFYGELQLGVGRLAV